MITRKFAVVIVILFLMFLNACALDESKAATQIDSNSKTDVVLDLGKIKPGEVIKHEFNFKNTSGKQLKIKEVLTSCGCTVLDVKNKDLPPGESTVIEVKFDSKGYHGAVEQFIYVNTDSIDNPIIKLIIRARVEK